MSLSAYKKKRDFRKTPEPAGKAGGGAGGAHGLHYVVQKHDASRLHYDFRLELDGALKSWAVPKGPSADPQRKALAVQVEDHPLDYQSFEGIIPKGQYGGGTVMVWDRGTWEPLEDPREGLAHGKLRFELHGQKLRGGWSLIQMHGPSADHGKNWLLIKSRDAYSGKKDILQDSQSVKTHRTMDEIAAQKKAVWQSKSRSAPVSASAARSHATSRNGKSPMPDRIAPQLATLARHPPDGDDWLHEIKFDGYRLLAFLDHEDVILRTRTGQDWTGKFGILTQPLKKLKATTAILDGEAVAMDDRGRNNFQLLQSSFKAAKKPELRYCVFDLLYLDGRDLRALPLVERKELLKGLLDKSHAPAALAYSDHVVGHGDQVVKKACALGSEGIVSKRMDAPYVSRRDPSWRKTKCDQRQEFVIIGYVASEKRSDGLRSLLLGYYDVENGLVYCGRVGTGFDNAQRRELMAKFAGLERKTPPTDAPPPRREQHAAHWVQPSLVCECHFEGWTRDGNLRHPAFIALRLDKPAQQVRREVPIEVSGAPRDSGDLGKRGKKVRGSETRPSGSVSTRAPDALQSAPLRSRLGATTQSSRHLHHLPEREVQPPWAGIELTHPERLVYPKEKIRKRDLADYYEVAAPFMLPHVIHRPLALMRCPAGLATKCFFMRNWSAALPGDIGKVEIKPGESHVMIDNLAGLFSLVQISALEIHGWNCTADDLDHPDQMVFDLDPGPGVPWKKVTAAADGIRKLLIGLGMKPFLKTTGGKGLHLTVPILPNVAWREVKAFCRTLAEFQVAQDDLFVANMRKDLRRGKIYIDFNRNDRTATAVAPYSSRARPGAVVSMPLSWDDLAEVDSADHFTLKNAGEYLAKRKIDPWNKFADSRVDLHAIVQYAPQAPAKE